MLQLCLSMKHRRLNEAGSLILPFIVVFLLLLGSLGFAAWAFAGRQDFKNNVDVKIAVAVKKAVAAEGVRKDAEAAEAAKSPLKNYKGPETFASVSFDYPRTWSAYVSEVGTGNTPINGYFNPNFVPDLTSVGVAWALRVQVINTSYAQLLKGFDNNVKNGKVTATPFRAAKVPDTLGTILTGTITSNNKTGTLVLVPVRDKTIEIWTEGTDYANDFNNTILPSFSFEP